MFVTSCLSKNIRKFVVKNIKHLGILYLSVSFYILEIYVVCRCIWYNVYCLPLTTHPKLLGTFLQPEQLNDLSSPCQCLCTEILQAICS